jgi:hypothetical protein
VVPLPGRLWTTFYNLGRFGEMLAARAVGRCGRIIAETARDAIEAAEICAELI